MNGMGANNMPQSYETRMVSMGEYGCIKLSAHNGMVGIGCTFNQAHMYDTGTFDVYGPGDGVYLFRMGDSRLSGPRYFTNLRMPPRFLWTSSQNIWIWEVIILLLLVSLE